MASPIDNRITDDSTRRYSDLFVFNSFSAESVDYIGNLNVFKTTNDGHLTQRNNFQSITLPQPSFETVSYIEGGWHSKRIINTGAVEWSELTLTQSLSSITIGNPFYDLLLSHQYGLRYKSNIIIKIYDKKGIKNAVKDSFALALESSDVILYCLIKGAVVSSLELVGNLDATGSEINVASAGFMVENVLYGLYNKDGNRINESVSADEYFL